jgi:hypothetical protein
MHPPFTLEKKAKDRESIVFQKDWIIFFFFFQYSANRLWHIVADWTVISLKLVNFFVIIILNMLLWLLKYKRKCIFKFSEESLFIM